METSFTNQCPNQGSLYPRRPVGLIDRSKVNYVSLKKTHFYLHAVDASSRRLFRYPFLPADVRFLLLSLGLVSKRSLS